MSATLPRAPVQSWQQRLEAPWSGCVRAATSEVVYVDVGRRLIALHGPAVEPFPFSVVLADGRPAHVTTGTRVRAAGDAVWIGERPRAVLAVYGAERIEPADDPAALRAAIEAAPAVARRRRELAGVLDVALAARRAGSCDEVARLLVGWGPGLTPSGDDVLVGLAAGAALGPRRRGAGALSGTAARMARTRTTFVSQALLEAAAAGAFPPALNALGLARDAAARDAAVARVACIGSRSGLDLLVGVGAGLEAGGAGG